MINAHKIVELNIFWKYQYSNSLKFLTGLLESTEATKTTPLESTETIDSGKSFIHQHGNTDTEISLKFKKNVN